MIIYGGEIDEEATVVLCEQVLGFVCSSSFPFKERRTDRLNFDAVFLRYFEDSLTGEIITDFLKNSLKVVVVVGDWNLLSWWSL